MQKLYCYFFVHHSSSKSNVEKAVRLPSELKSLVLSSSFVFSRYMPWMMTLNYWKNLIALLHFTPNASCGSIGSEVIQHMIHFTVRIPYIIPVKPFDWAADIVK